jgi:hypothetical protein
MIQLTFEEMQILEEGFIRIYEKPPDAGGNLLLVLDGHNHRHHPTWELTIEDEEELLERLFKRKEQRCSHSTIG